MPTDVFITLDGIVIPNRGYVVISDIGSTDEIALLCHTNRPRLPGSHHSDGNWLAPDGTRVYRNDVPGFTRNRGPKVVRLKKSTTGTPAQGIYRCSIMDAQSTFRKIYVGLYNIGGGINDRLESCVST